jgi:hypothetical protein
MTAYKVACGPTPGFRDSRQPDSTCASRNNALTDMWSWTRRGILIHDLLFSTIVVLFVERMYQECSCFSLPSSAAHRGSNRRSGLNGCKEELPLGRGAASLRKALHACASRLTSKFPRWSLFSLARVL